MLEQITKGKTKKPYLLMLYGVEGIGKSTFGSHFPNPIFLGGESGTDNLDVSRFPKVLEWEELQESIDDLLEKEHDFKTLVIDTIDSLEPILWDKIKRDSGTKSIELACGGYGKGYIKAMEEFQALTHKLDLLREKGMNILILAHSAVSKFHDPITNIEYDRYSLKLHKRTLPVFVEWVDALLFANHEVFTSENENGRKSAIGSGKRVIHSEKRPSFDAKNRFNLPFELPLDFSEIEKHLEEFYEAFDPTKIADELIEKVQQLKDENLRETVTKYIKDNKDDAEAIRAARNRVTKLLGGK